MTKINNDGEHIVQIFIEEGKGSLYGIKREMTIDDAQKILEQHCFKKSEYSNSDPIYYARGEIRIGLHLDYNYMEALDTINRISIDYIPKETHGGVPESGVVY